MLNEMDKQFLLNSLRDIKNFPKSGIIFKDITTLLNNAKAFKILIIHLEEHYKKFKLDYIAGLDSRGFIFGAALAIKLGIGFVPIRKKGKLPSKTINEKYNLEYGTDELEIHTDAFNNTKNARVLLIDDLIATGGTAIAGVKLIQALAICVESCFILGLKSLDGINKIKKVSSYYCLLEID